MVSIADPHWLLFLGQLPASPSSARVALWRRLRGAGAISVLNGAWILPESDEHRSLFAQLSETVCKQSGNAALFVVQPISPGGNEAIIARFQADRAREYGEFAERCRGFLDEIGRETHVQKFTFAELEEVEDDHQKLGTWLGKIRRRDFFPDHRASETAGIFERCDSALRAFTHAVYSHEGVDVASAEASSSKSRARAAS